MLHLIIIGFLLSFGFFIYRFLFKPKLNIPSIPVVFRGKNGWYIIPIHMYRYHLELMEELTERFGETIIAVTFFKPLFYMCLDRNVWEYEFFRKGVKTNLTSEEIFEKIPLFGDDKFGTFNMSKQKEFIKSNLSLIHLNARSDDITEIIEDHLVKWNNTDLLYMTRSLLAKITLLFTYGIYSRCMSDEFIDVFIDGVLAALHPWSLICTLSPFAKLYNLVPTSFSNCSDSISMLRIAAIRNKSKKFCYPIMIEEAQKSNVYVDKIAGRMKVLDDDQFKAIIDHTVNTTSATLGNTTQVLAYSIYLLYSKEGKPVLDKLKELFAKDEKQARLLVNCIVYETVQVFAALFSARWSREDATVQCKGKDILIPKGSTIFVPLYHFKHKNTWKPLELYESNAVNREKGSIDVLERSKEQGEFYVPFGFNNHACPGKDLAQFEVFMVLKSLINRKVTVTGSLDKLTTAEFIGNALPVKPLYVTVE